MAPAPWTGPHDEYETSQFFLISTKITLKRLSERVDEFPRQPDVEEVDQEEKLASQGCHGLSGAMGMLEDSRCRGWLNAVDFEPLVVGLVGSSSLEGLEFQDVLLGDGPPDAEEEVPACLGLDDKRPPLGCRGLLDVEEVPEDTCRDVPCVGAVC